jgi:hypothetical protein
MDLKVDTNEMRELIGEALLRAIDEKSREALIAAAIRSLLERDGSSYDRRSPIERAFAFAAQSIAQKTAEQMLGENDEFKAALEGMVAEAASKVIGEGRAQMVENIARAISKGLEPRA